MSDREHDLPPEKRIVRGAVGWLLGPELIGRLRKILRRRSDPRDWMPYYKGFVHDERAGKKGELVCVTPDAAALAPGPNRSRMRSRRPQAGEGEPRPGAERIIPEADPSLEPGREKEGIWFDYIADAGDSVDSMYAVAYALQFAFVHAERSLDATTWKERGRVPLQLAHHAKKPDAAKSQVLPLGEFLVVGGDTAYHVADGATLLERVEVPFAWAAKDAPTKVLSGAGAPTEAEANTAMPIRRLYGIPGNHDWYDNLEGFSLVFRLGSPSRPAAAPDNVDASTTGSSRLPENDAPPPIQIAGFEPMQLASWVAIQLPCDWQIWGLDIDGGIDHRQAEYFMSVPKPSRLIVLTPSPGIVFGQRLPDPEKHDPATDYLAVPVPRVPLRNGNAVMPTHRLDLSGDVHHYARYYPDEKVRTYGSVVSGLGGAFHHPSFTESNKHKKPIKAVAMYPVPDESRRRIGEELLTWKSAWFGSWARIVPLLLTVLLGYASTSAVGGRWVLDHVLSWFPRSPSVRLLQTPSDGTYWLGHSALVLVAVLGFVGALVGVFWWGARIYKKQEGDSRVGRNIVDVWKNRHQDGFWRPLIDPNRSYWLTWVVGLAILGGFLYFWWWTPPAPSRGLDISTIVIVFALPIAGIAIAIWLGAKHVRGAQKIGIAIAGFVHMSAHVLTALLFASVASASWQGAAAAIATGVLAMLLLHVARPAFRLENSGVATALLALLWLVAMAAMFIGIPLVGGGRYVESGHTPMRELLHFGFASLFAMPVGTTWFIWYLAVCARMNGHNNEAGGAARVTDYRQMIRFNVHEEGLTGYVISIENEGRQEKLRYDAKDEGDKKAFAARCKGENLRFHLIDVFTIETR